MEKELLLANGVNMPLITLGTNRLQGSHAVQRIVEEALEVGYRAFHTAHIYQNEREIGRVLSQSPYSRQLLFIASQLSLEEQGYHEALRAFESSRHSLNLEYIDLLIMPFMEHSRMDDTWRALEILYHRGDVRAIGVTGANNRQLEHLLKSCSIKPHVLQMPYHPLGLDQSLVNICHDHQLTIQACQPLKQGEMMYEPFIQELARKHKKTPAQIVLRWALQNGVAIIPGSTDVSRMKENFALFTFELPLEDMVNLQFYQKNSSNRYYYE
ncbi:oxidoreductase, aldo/keto reductase family protein [Fictibacillus macauensis ZFHKF-1]|uniref:Oxidoreductase, aldo/keto reductase family protein n=1 Tax=Fictibacillus macauensis ZFHKF-1 TaxID=1196324 RepID=I8UFM9_9BACL|nr:aldo/keto reductase [Fictibacillus macauensis]EIT85700.1 oxidoreductase, aldo/keto reductase family protein [Fictibacillus macauensis ZFHKF-1]